MKNILLIHGLLESIVGFLLIFNPQWLLLNTQPEIQGVVIAKLYGIMIFGFGLISYLLSKSFEYNQMYRQICLVVISLHLIIGLYMYGVFQQGVTPHPGAAVLHLTLAVIFLAIYLKNMQKFNHEQPTS
jgi:cell shape-determining protein MreD